MSIHMGDGETSIPSSNKRKSNKQKRGFRKRPTVLEELQEDADLLAILKSYSPTKVQSPGNNAQHLGIDSPSRGRGESGDPSLDFDPSIADSKDAYQAAHREKLQFDLNRQVTSFWKDFARISDFKPGSPEASLLPVWALKHGPERARKRIRKIAKSKRDALCLGIEVDQLLWQQRMILAASTLTESENPEARQKRLQGFWEKFHAPIEKSEVMKPCRSGVKSRSALAANLLDTKNNFYSAHGARGSISQPLRTNASSGHKVHAGHDTTDSRKNKVGNKIRAAGSKDGSCEEIRSPSRSGRNVRSRHMHRHRQKVTDLRGVDALDFFGKLGKSNSESELSAKDVLPPDWMPDHGLFLTDVDEEEPQSGRSSGSPTPSMQSSPQPQDKRISRLSRSSRGSVSLPRLDQPEFRPAVFQSRPNRGQSGYNSTEVALLPPIVPLADTFRSPWCKGGVLPHQESGAKQQVYQSDSEENPTERYLKVCRVAGIVPTPMPFVTGHSQELNASGLQLVDDDLKALASMVHKQKRLEAVQLDGNSLLTDKAMVPFLRKLFGPPAMVSLERLSLRECTRVGKSGMQVVVSLIADPQGVRSLHHLDLSGVGIPSHLHLPLCNAVYDHPALRSLNLGETGIGQSPFASQCVCKILGSGSLQKLDLGWNCFQPDVFEHLAKSLEMNEDLRELCIANCAAAPVNEDDVPISHLMEGFARDRSLTRLDLSMNRIDFRAALVLEDALSDNKRLTDVILSFNPLGVAGMRCVLRLLCKNTSGLVRFQCDRCGAARPSRKREAASQTFNPTSPACRYVLNLARPYDRAILRLLYDTCDRFGLDPNVGFIDLQFDQGAWSHPRSRDSYDEWVIPLKGILQCTFSLDEVLQKEFAGDFDSKSFSAAQQFVDMHKHNMFMKPAFRKIVPLLAQFRSLSSMPSEQSVFLDALSKDFILMYPHLEQLTRNRNVATEVLAKLMHCVGGGQSERFLVLQLSPSVTHYLEVCRRAKNVLSFNVENPTGHYKLKLDNSADYAVTDQLLLLDSWETCICKRQGRPDTSQRGNYSCIRNERFQNRLVGPQFLAEWTIPDHDKLELDYVSARRPPLADCPLNGGTWNRMLKILCNTACSPAERVEVLRRISSQIYVTTLQLRELLGCFRDDDCRLDVFTVFFLRLVDPENEKIIRARIEDEEERKLLRKRMGHVNLFPFMQPEQTTFELDFSVYEERTAAFMILSLAKKEDPANMKNLSYIRADGTEVEAPPIQSWMLSADNLPQSGTLTLTYKCDPDDRCLQYRRSLAEEYGGWYMDDITSSEVLWWTSLTDAPDDVLEFLEFLLGRFEDLDKAFTAIDGKDGNGFVSLKEMEDGLKRLKCQKFKHDRQRMVNVFRWLDPGNEGSISRAEWGVLKELAQELTLSMQEFAAFLHRMMDGPSPLETAWDLLDYDDSGTVSKDEWEEAVENRLKYFGAIDAIFNYLDKDDEGTISLEEWRHLADFESHIHSRTPKVGFDESLVTNFTRLF